MCHSVLVCDRSVQSADSPLGAIHSDRSAPATIMKHTREHCNSGKRTEHQWSPQRISSCVVDGHGGKETFSTETSLKPLHTTCNQPGRQTKIPGKKSKPLRLRDVRRTYREKEKKSPALIHMQETLLGYLNHPLEGDTAR